MYIATPQNVNGHATGSTSLSLYWSPPPSQHQNGRIRYYHINMTDEATNILASFKTPNTRWTVSSLHPYTRYHCGVAAVTVAQGPSAFITIQTNQSGTSLIQYKFPSDSFRCNGNLLLKYNSFSHLLRSSQILYFSCSPYSGTDSKQYSSRECHYHLNYFAATNTERKWRCHHTLQHSIQRI